MPSSLRNAHQGYQYQDLATAIELVRLVLSGRGVVKVDRKDHDKDKFDDITVHSPGIRACRQLKWTGNESRELSLDDFTGARSSVRMDTLVASHHEMPREPETEVRLAVRWGHPTEADLLDYLEEVPATTPVFEGTSTKRYRLRADKIWPGRSAPVWPVLGSVSRDDFIAFSREFVIETSLPSCSLDVSEPGELERYLLDLLVSRVGIGAFPNQHRVPEDVAARLINIAATARSIGATLSSDEVCAKISLQRDFGHIIQVFPFRSDQYVSRGALRHSLYHGIQHHRRIILTGPPGSGKSWELTTLADFLRSQGHLVARHYCYISPDDDYAEKRITTDVMYGNIIQELLDSDPSLASSKQRRFAANAQELNSLLSTASQSGPADRLVVVVVDGLDHIERVAQGATRICRSQMAIVDDLASLDWPDGTCLVIGSQPGEHLTPLVDPTSDAQPFKMPPLSDEEISSIASSLRLDEVLDTIGEEASETRAILAERSEGNALFVTMLIRGAVAAAERGVVPLEYIRDTPSISGDLNRYYKYLYGRLSRAGKRLANVLGVVDFAVTTEDLGSILGEVSALGLEEDLRELDPLLVDVAGRGGIRIFHESFRRFIIECAPDPGTALRIHLSPVITWLQALGFYRSGLSFRYLLPSLARAGRIDDLFRTIEPSFVSKAIEHCHPREEIQRNLDYAVSVAAAHQRYPDLIRIAHLHRSAFTCFEEHLIDGEPYWEAHLALHGPSSTAQRLCPDGLTVLGRHEGLRLCSKISDNGGSPPWSAYLGLPVAEFQRDYSSSYLRKIGDTLAAILHGMAHVEGVDAASRWAEEKVVNIEVPSSVIGRLGARWVMLDEDGFESIFDKEAVSPATKASLAISAAEALYRSDKKRAEFYISIAVLHGTTPEILARCAKLGAALRFDPAVLGPESIDISRSGYRSSEWEVALATWLGEVRLLAYLDTKRLHALRKAITQPAWYGCWLRFSTFVFEAEALALDDKTAASIITLSGFRELSRDTNPFRGDPRAMDLWGVRDLVRGTIRWALTNLQPSEWPQALEFLLLTVKDTTTYLSGAPGGPVGFDGFIDLLEPYVADDRINVLVVGAIEKALHTAREHGQYYSVQADLELAATKLLARGGSGTAAQAHWAEAARQLTGYGHRKDVTIFELIDSLGFFSGDSDLFLGLVERLWPLLAAVVAHTDGRETKHGPNALLRLLAEHSPAAALSVVYKNILGERDAVSWIDERAYQETIRACFGHVDPLLLLLAETTIRFELEHGDRSGHRIEPLSKAISATRTVVNPRRTPWAETLLARAEGDPERPGVEGWDELLAVAKEVGVAGPATPFGAKETADGDSKIPARQRTTSAENPHPPDADSLMALMGWIRSTLLQRDLYDEVDDSLVNRIGYRCVALAQDGREQEARRLIDFTQRAYPSYSMGKWAFFQALGEGLERHGLKQLASRSLALAFTESRGGSGWHSIGDEKHAHLLDAAETNDPVEARAVFAEEAAAKAVDGYAMGLTEAVIGRLMRWDPDQAEQAWLQALAVVERRLNTVKDRQGWLPSFERSHVISWDIRDSLVTVIAARCSHPEVDRRVAALLAFAHAVQLWPSSAGFALGQVLGKGPSPTATLELLQVVWEAEEEPFLVTGTALEALERCCGHAGFGVRHLAVRLLERAGLSAILAVPKPIDGYDAVDNEEVEAVADFAGREMMDSLAHLWHEFPAKVASRFKCLREDDSLQTRREARAKFAGERDVDPSFWTPIVFTNDELLAQAMHECANGIPLHQVASGSYEPQVETRALGLLLPDLHLQLGLEASRTPRPLLKRPEEATAVSVAPRALVEPGPYQGWIRIGLYEREYLGGDRSWSPEPTTRFTHVAGLHGAGTPISDSDVPLGVASRSGWRIASSFALPFLGPLGAGPVVGLLMEKALPMGRYVALMLPPALCHRMGLRSAPWPGPLALQDGNGVEVIRLRRWEVGAMHRGERPSRLSGCDLVAHPNFYRRLSCASGGPMFITHRVFKSDCSS